MALITLTTDFGTRSHFVAAVKGVLLGVHPAARVIDLSHDIPPYDIRHVSFFLAEAVPYFPPDTLHVVVVDPGVGSAREVLFVSVAGQRLLVPDNGCWTQLAAGHEPRVIRVRESRFFRPTVSATFHGRDIFAPVAGHLSLGLDPAELGPAATSWQELAWPAPRREVDTVVGEVVFIDHFGNLISNVRGDELPAFASVRVGGHVVERRVRTYAEVPPGELVALVSSSGLLEVAEVQGNAARRLGAAVGTPFIVRRGASRSGRGGTGRWARRCGRR